MMRTMRTEMQKMEDRVMAKMQAMLVEARKENHWTETRLSGCIAPLVQCLASEQIEMREKIAQIDAQVSDLASTPTASSTHTIKDAETLEEELQQEVATLGEKDATQADRSQPAKIPPQGQTAIVDFKRVFGESDSRLQWPTANTASIPYSNKLGKGPLAPAVGFEARWQPGDKWSYVKLGDEVAPPFAQSISKSTFGHRSCPLLPPLH